LKRELPEAMKPRRIAIGNGSPDAKISKLIEAEEKVA